MPSRSDKLKMLFAFWKAYHKDPKQMAKWCPFHDHYGNLSCDQLCYSFELLDTGLHTNMDRACPCHAYGNEGALQRLEEVLRGGGYYLDMRYKNRIVTIVPCKECHEHPCTCALLGPTKE
jgi:hypothetical protein